MTLTVGASVQDYLPKNWAQEETRRAFWRTSDTLYSDAGKPYAFALDGEGQAMIPPHRRELDSPEALAAMNPGLSMEPSFQAALARSRGMEETVTFRRRLARPVAYVRKIANHYVAHVMRAPSVATGASFERWNEWSKKAGAGGESMANILRTAMRVGMVEGSCGILIDWTGAAPASAADVRSSAVVARVIRPSRIICTTSDDGGRVTEAMLLMDDAAGAFIWRVTAEITQKATVANGRITSVSPEEKHGYGRCPFFLLDGLPSIIPGVAEGQKAIARTDSLLRYRCHEDAIPWQVLSGVQNAAGAKAMLLQMPLVTILEEPNATAQILGADIGVAESLRKTMAQDEEQLYEDAKVSPVAGSAPESGVAHAYRWVDADVELAACAEEIEAAEQHAADCVSSQLSWEESPRITRSRTFVPYDRSAAILSLSQVSASTLPEAIKEREYLDAAAKLYPGDTQIADELHAETEMRRGGI